MQRTPPASPTNPGNDNTESWSKIGKKVAYGAEIATGLGVCEKVGEKAAEKAWDYLFPQKAPDNNNNNDK